LYRQLVKGTVASVHADAAALSVNLSHITEEWVTKVQRLRSQAKILDAMQVFNSIASLYYDDIDDHKVRLLSWLRDGKFGGPILIIWGIGDPMTSLADATDLFEVCAGSGTSQVRMYMLSDCGHYPFREYPTEFGSAITTFVETFD
jgi:pimeloyl-ACP methyl ester carboxylesterase